MLRRVELEPTIALIEAALAAATEHAARYREPGRRLRWYRASGERLRWVVHAVPGFAFLEDQHTSGDPMPEGHSYGVELLLPQKAVLVTHSNVRVGPMDWESVALQSATLVHLEWIDAAERMGKPGLDVLLRGLFEKHPPNLFSRT